MSTTLRSKEEILAKYEYEVHYYGGGRRHILAAMEEYANQFRQLPEKNDESDIEIYLPIELKEGNELPAIDSPQIFIRHDGLAQMYDLAHDGYDLSPFTHWLKLTTISQIKTVMP